MEQKAKKGRLIVIQRIFSVLSQIISYISRPNHSRINNRLLSSSSPVSRIVFLVLLRDYKFHTHLLFAVVQDPVTVVYGKVMDHKRHTQGCY